MISLIASLKIFTVTEKNNEQTFHQSQWHLFVFVLLSLHAIPLEQNFGCPVCSGISF